MATTWIKPVHKKPTNSPSSSVKVCMDYILDDKKTHDGKYVFSHECSIGYAHEEFTFTKEMYELETGKSQKNPILAYSVRQSFMPGEIDPEKALEIGKELADQLTNGGEFSYVVATHIDREHIHNHIIFNAYNNDYETKFNNPSFSYAMLRKVSDEICEAHNLSVIAEPQLGNNTYTLKEEHMLENRERTPNARKEMELFIEKYIQVETPQNFEELIEGLKEYGVEVKDKTKAGKRKAQISLRLSHRSRAIRMDTLSDNYKEEALRKRLDNKEYEQNQTQADESYVPFPYDIHTTDPSTALDEIEATEQERDENTSEKKSENSQHSTDQGNATHTKKSEYRNNISKILIDIENSQKAQDSKGYKKWATLFNLKVASETLLYLEKNGLQNMDKLDAKVANIQSTIDSYTNTINEAETRMKEISEIQKHIGNYNKNKSLFSNYQRMKQNSAFYNAHKKEIDMVVEAKAYFDSLGLDSIPTIKTLRAEYGKLKSAKFRALSERKKAYAETQEVRTAKKNIDTILKRMATEKEADKTKSKTESEKQKRSEER